MGDACTTSVLYSCSALQAAGYVFDESLGRVLPADQEEDIKKKGNVNELPPSEVCMKQSTLIRVWIRFRAVV